MRSTEDDDLAAIAEELYALPPGEFTAARDAAAKRARADGDRALAASVSGLRRPTLAAWVVNTLVRRHPDELEQVLAVGAALREAQAALSGDRLRALGRQRQQVLAALVRQARTMARGLGHPVSDAVGQEVEETLSAALADPAAEAAVRAGLLTSHLSYAGLGEVDVSAAVALAAAGPRAAPRAEQPRAETARSETARAEQARAETARARAAAAEQALTARFAAEEAEQAARRAQAESDAARGRREAAQAALEAAQAQLRAAEQELSDAGRDAREAARRAAAAGRTAELARGTASAAQARLDGLPDAEP